MMLQQEKEKANSVSFNVEIKRTTSTDNPSLRKRLEKESEAAAPALTLEKINEKLHKAEENRKTLMKSQERTTQKRNKHREKVEKKIEA